MPIPPPERSGYTVSTDVPLYWCAYGREGAPRLVVLHGGPGAHHDYLLPQFLALADEYELFFYDQRGGGRSRTTHAAAITWETQVGDLTRVVQESASTPLSLVGYSWGGMLALLYGIQAAARRTAPEPARLVLVDPAPISSRFRATFEEEFARRQRAPGVQAMRDALTQSGLRDADPDAFRQRSFELSVAGYFADPRAATNLTPFRVMGRVQDSVWASLGDYDLAAALPAVRCATLVVHGRDDPIPLESSARAAELLRAEFVPLDACGHVPYVEAPAALFHAIRSFLSRTSSSGSV